MRNLLAALLALAVPTLSAAQDRSIFSVLDTSGRSIGPAPALAEGALSERDVLTGDGRRVQVWTLTGAPGNELQIDLRSDAFDAYVYVVGPGLGGGITDDDGGEDLDSRICLAASEPGEYRVVASSLSGDTGSFTLEVRRRDGATTGPCLEEVVEEAPEIDDPWELPVEGRVLNVGDDVEGALDEADAIFLGSPAEAWRVPARAGERFSVDLISEDFDAYLELEGPEAVDILDDDDGAGRCDARITLTFAESGEYVLVATTLGSRRGSYRLVATREPGPVQSGSCVEVDEPTGESSSSLDAVAVVGALNLGATVQGTMTGTEAQFAGSGLQGWTLEANAGDRIAIDNVSDDFDSYLYLTGPGFPDYIYDDDSAGSLDARLCVEIPESATYRVYAGPLSGTGQGGRYQVLVREGSDDLCSTYELTPAAQARVLAELDTEGRSLSVDQEREGTLDPNGFRHPDSDRVVQAWSLALTAGREVTVDLVSNAFDPVLYVLGPGLDEPHYVDDFGGGICNSRVTFTPTVTGTFRILAGAYYDGGGGAFTLRASTNPPDLEQGGCVSPDDVASTSTTTSSGDVTLSGPLAGISSGQGRMLEVGTEVEGTLDAADEVLDTEQFAEVWSAVVSAGDEIVFELLSDDFDCILFVDDGTGSPMRDDDSAGNLDSRIVYTADAARTVRVVVSALSAGNSGSFRLRAIRRAS